MDAYFEFLNHHVMVMVRAFFVLMLAIDLVFVYAAVFDRDLPRRIAVRFFSALSGQPVGVETWFVEQDTRWYRWLVFGFVCAVPPVAWGVIEWVVAVNGR